MEDFFDSSSVLELIGKNEAYDKFQNETILTNTLNLSEIHNVLLRAHGEQTADYWATHLNFYFLEITPEIAVKASKFKHKHKKEGISYADCIGYISSLKHNLKFLTGDAKFQNKENVEFIKKTT